VSGAVRRRLDAGRWHFQHGPIDCILGADAAADDAGADAFADAHAHASADAVEAGFERAWMRFGGLLDELVGELPLLRADLAAAGATAIAPAGPVARRMVDACRPHARGGRFITAMAAVAGSVADELIGAFADPRIVRAYVNDGGDIALHLRPGAFFDIGLFTDPAHGLSRLAPDGRLRIGAGSPVRGVATSGWRGRSLSLGIADSVTVLAPTAAAADAAATVIANAVDVDDRRIERRPADAVRDDSDLGRRLVTCAVPVLADAQVAAALAAGVAVARAERASGRIMAAVLALQGRFAIVGDVGGGSPAIAPVLPASLHAVPARSLAPC